MAFRRMTDRNPNNRLHPHAAVVSYREEGVAEISASAHAAFVDGAQIRTVKQLLDMVHTTCQAFAQYQSLAAGHAPLLDAQDEAFVLLQEIVNALKR